MSTTQFLNEEQSVGTDSVKLLQVPPGDHKSSVAQLRPKEVISYRALRLGIPMHDSCKENLQKLGLYQVATLGSINIYPNIVASLIERWRPETHSFHLPFGEMTVTLQDKLLHTTVPEKAFRVKMVRGEETYSSYHLRREWLHKEFARAPSGESRDYVDAYTRAFCLDLIGSILLPDSTGDSIPAMYIQFLEDLESPPRYNWGAAVLAHLYRSLCRASFASSKFVYGPLMLLQLWHWNRFSIARPVLVDGTACPSLGGEDLESRPPFGIKWSGHHSFRDSPHNGIEFYREQYEKVTESKVVWQPYDEKISLLHPRVRKESALWLARVPLIHFCVVEDHYPDRVMRQFGLFQSIPPPMPRDWASSVILHKFVYGGGDWAVKHAEYVSVWQELSSVTVTEERPYDPTTRDQYWQWFEQEAVFRRAVALDLEEASYGIKCVQNQGTRKIGKTILKFCRARLQNSGHIHALNNMLQKYNLPLEIDDIQDDSESEVMNVPVADSIEESQFDQFLRQQEFNTENAECMCAIEPRLDPPATPVHWPEDGILTREWITNLSAILDWSSRHLKPSLLPTVLPTMVVEKLLLLASVHLHAEPNCVVIDPRPDQTVTIVGDVHGQLHDLLFLLQAAGFPSDKRMFVFNGDYVDRGAWGFETLIVLLAWKVFLVDCVFLLRGNHESKDCTLAYGFHKEVLAKYGNEGEKVYQMCLKCFADLPLASVLSPNEERGLDLLWGPDVTQEFLETNNLKLIIRSHEGPDARHNNDDLPGVDKGYAVDHVVKSGKLITLFSAPDYPQFQASENRYNNDGAYIVLGPPDFADPEYHSFKAVKPRPEALPYYDVEPDEELDLEGMSLGSHH
ncbi:hypothetical protein C2845_PM11G22280 [Panicum miliaceum]|uniref:Serine/threonine specific protein phosphatases domain-containing protein n=1 Tax=Panicum miliaceum TaxID=4540 RepID=A0A3L6RSG3_PANMI|nr:hypothetical protein C2845_PM11G22280 [Panicum miliaceum]